MIQGQRGSGILLHITSLPSPYGVGDLGPEAYSFADFLSQTKQAYWQVLPLNPTYPVYGNSPCKSVSSFAGNTLLISPDLLLEEGQQGPLFLEIRDPTQIKGGFYDEDR
jgi:4-alpha-glucanotransferase